VPFDPSWRRPSPRHGSDRGRGVAADQAASAKLSLAAIADRFDEW
jgi:hypothetical protein